MPVARSPRAGWKDDGQIGKPLPHEAKGQNGMAMPDVGILLRRAGTTEEDICCLGETRQLLKGRWILAESRFYRDQVGALEEFPRVLRWVCKILFNRLLRGTQTMSCPVASVLPHTMGQRDGCGASAAVDLIARQHG